MLQKKREISCDSSLQTNDLKWLDSDSTRPSHGSDSDSTRKNFRWLWLEGLVTLTRQKWLGHITDILHNWQAYIGMQYARNRVYFTAVDHWAKVPLSLLASQYSDFTCLWTSLSSSMVYAENFHGGSIQWHIVVICIWCAVCDVTIWRHIHVSRPTFWRSLLTKYAYSSTRTLLILCVIALNINYQRSRLGYRRKINSTLQHSSSSPKISGCAL